MPRWLPRVLSRIHILAADRRICFTLKARRELALLGDGLDEDDARELLAALTAQDSAGRLKSRETGEWMYIFKPRVEMTVIYVKVIVRSNCVVVSFHTDEGAGHDEDP